MDKGSQEALSLRRMPWGGFVVRQVGRPGDFAEELFASTSIDEALKFMRDMVNPIPPVQGEAGRS